MTIDRNNVNFMNPAAICDLITARSNVNQNYGMIGVYCSKIKVLILYSIQALHKNMYMSYSSQHFYNHFSNLLTFIFCSILVRTRWRHRWSRVPRSQRCGWHRWWPRLLGGCGRAVPRALTRDHSLLSPRSPQALSKIRRSLTTLLCNRKKTYPFAVESASPKIRTRYEYT